MKILNISVSTPIYNGRNLKEIISKLPVKMHKTAKVYYIQNCIEVYKNEKQNVNLALNELIRNTNFHLVNTNL